MTRRVLVLGAGGFIGRNLVTALRRRPSVDVREHHRDDPPEDLLVQLDECDFVYHLAGVNRPADDEDFHRVNAGFTRDVVQILQELHRVKPIAFTSSIQAVNDTPYGRSKRCAEALLQGYHDATGAAVYIYRLPNVFGRWARPHYNSVVATFCHDVARGIDPRIDAPDRVLHLVYIEDVVSQLAELSDPRRCHAGLHWQDPPIGFRVTVAGLARRIRELADVGDSLVLPDLHDRFTRCLYATFLSYCPSEGLLHEPAVRGDERGELVELLKSPCAGQVFVSTSRPGVERGGHYHDHKVEKFCVLRGHAQIRLQSIVDDDVRTYEVSGERVAIVDVPPGYTHTIRNTAPGHEELLVLFWASEIFDPADPDTYR